MMEPMHELLQEAKKGGYGIPAPNVYNRFTIEAALQAADELNAPVILGCPGVFGIEEVGELARYYERKYPRVPFAVNLDHGGPFDHLDCAIRAGFSSVMVDRSTLPYEQNVAESKEIVKIAHAVGVSVEAELGHVGQGVEYEQTRDAGLTHPEEAVSFVEETGVDCLAVAVGTSHGAYKGTPHLEFELLETIAKSVDVPLVLHGGSGTGDDLIAKAIKCGIQKVNLWTDLSQASNMAVKEAIEADYATDVDPDKKKISSWQYYDMIGADGYKAALEHYMHVFGCVGKAKELFHALPVHQPDLALLELRYLFARYRSHGNTRYRFVVVQ